MKRTTISLPDALAAAVEREARRRRTSVSEVARRALEVHLGWTSEGPRPLPFAALGASGMADVADGDETYLRDHWARDLEIDGRDRAR